MIPYHLYVCGFLSYRQPVELDFTGFSLACVAGANGAGKSSLLDAITWALFGQARRRDEAVIHAHPEVKTAEVVFTFEYEGALYRVQRIASRGKPTELWFYIQQPSTEGGDSPTWKSLTERTQRATQERIQRILRMDYETFINASFFLQGKADQFTQQRPGERKRILGSILGLEVWEEYRERAAKKRAEIESEVDHIQGRLGEIEAELGEESSRRERLEQLKKELAQVTAARRTQEEALELMRKAAAALEEKRRLVDAFRRQVRAAETRLEDLQERLRQRQAEKQSMADLIHRAEQIRADYQNWQAARQSVQRWEDLAEVYRRLERQRQEPEAEIQATRLRLEQERAHWVARQQEIQMRQTTRLALQEQLDQAVQALEQAEAELERRRTLEAELDDLRQKLPQLEAENQRLKVEMEELKATIEKLEADSICPLCGQTLSQVDRARLLETLQRQGKEKGDQFRANKMEHDQADQVKRDLQQQIQALSHAPASVMAHSRKVEQLRVQIHHIDELVMAWEAETTQRLEVERQLTQEDFCHAARQRLSEIEQEMQRLGYDAAAHEDARQKEAAGRQAEQELRDLEKAQATLNALEREITELQAQALEAQAELEKLSDECQRSEQELAESEARTPDLRTGEQQLDYWREQENILRMQIGAAQQKVDVLGDLKKRRSALESRKQTLLTQISRYKQLEKAFSQNGVPALLIEQALPQIELRANAILDRLSGGGMTVRFVTQEAYKDKRRADLRETLDIQISDASGTRDYELYSGGEAFRVNFAIRLALSEVLAQRAGARLQMLVVDEGFGSQDALGRQRLIETINMVKDDFAKILIITHIEELKDAFPNRIEVEKTEHGSRLWVV